jgi:hypothetical protein
MSDNVKDLSGNLEWRKGYSDGYVAALIDFMEGEWTWATAADHAEALVGHWRERLLNWVHDGGDVPQPEIGERDDDSVNVQESD